MAKLKEFAFARSGDKGNSANIGVIARNADAYLYLKETLSAEKVGVFFHCETVRYELDNLQALNFVLKDVLEGGASFSLKSDSQGKSLGQKLLEIDI